MPRQPLYTCLDVRHRTAGIHGQVLCLMLCVEILLFTVRQLVDVRPETVNLPTARVLSADRIPGLSVVSFFSYCFVLRAILSRAISARLDEASSIVSRSIERSRRMLFILVFHDHGLQLLMTPLLGHAE